jgi:chitodextrinase
LATAIDILRGLQPPPPAKFPRAKAWKEDTVYYEGDVVAFAGGTYQARRDTAKAPWTEDWALLAAAGAPGKSPVVRGTFDPSTEYGQLDVVALDGSSFIALRDQPGPCPGANWQLVASCGCSGLMGERGEHGRVATIVSWQIDRSTYAATPILSDGSEGAPLQLRELFHRGHLDIEREVLIESFGEALGMARNKLLDQIEPQLQKINALELKLAELTGTIDVLRGLQPSPPAKFPTIRVWSEDTIYHEGDIIAFAGGTWQALRDTARAPGAQDWVCLATPGNSLTVRGTYDGDGDYRCLDVTMVNGSSFIALKDRPGPCPSSDWQLLASRGSRGDRGPKGERGLTGPRGEHGAAAPTIRTWEVERASYAATPIMSDGSKGPPLELRALFEQFLSERGE